MLASHCREGVLSTATGQAKVPSNQAISKVPNHQTGAEIMATRVTIGLIALVAIIQGLAADAMPEGIMALLLALLGLVYAFVAIDAEDATAFLVVVLAVGAAAHADVLSHIHVVGEYLDAIVDQVVIALYAGVITILVVRTYNRLKG